MVGKHEEEEEEIGYLSLLFVGLLCKVVLM
jgi:hypothetical protein